MINFDKAVYSGEIDGYQYWILPAPVENALNGYVFFPKRPVREYGYDGILTYVPVHGGITYAEPYKKGMVYGFDTLHCNSNEYPRLDKEWLISQCKIMIKGILKAAEVEDKYLRCKTNNGKAKHCEYVMEVQPEMERSFGVNINLLSGKL